MRKGQGRRPSRLWIVGPAAVCALLAGCVDFGHTGVYRLALNAPPASTSASVYKGQSQAEIEHIASQMLLDCGFREVTGQRTIWLKDGATVQLDRTEDDALLLSLTSMGAPGGVRAAVQIEDQLAQSLKACSTLTVTAIKVSAGGS